MESKVVDLLASAIGTRKNAAKTKSLNECGVYAEFFSGDAMDASYDDVAEELRTRHDMDLIDPTAVYSPKQLLDVLEMFARFSVLTHQQILRLVPPHEDLVSSFDLVRQQLLRELPVVAVRLQYKHMRATSGAHIQYTFVPALNGAAFASFVHLLEAASPSRQK